MVSLMVELGVLFGAPVTVAPNSRFALLDALVACEEARGVATHSFGVGTGLAVAAGVVDSGGVRWKCDRGPRGRLQSRQTVVQRSQLGFAADGNEEIARGCFAVVGAGSNTSGLFHHRPFATDNSITRSEHVQWLKWHAVPLQPCLLERVHEFTWAAQEIFVPHRQHSPSVSPRGKVPSKIALDVLGPKVHRRWKTDPAKGVCTLLGILLQFDRA